MTAARDWKKDRERWEAIRSIIQASEFAEGFVPAALDEIERLQGLIDEFAKARNAYYLPGAIYLPAGDAYESARDALLAAARKPEAP